MEKKDSNKKLKEGNVNIYVEKNKNSIVPILFIIIVILLIILGIVLYYNKDSNNSMDNTDSDLITDEDISSKIEDNIELDLKDNSTIGKNENNSDTVAKMYEKIENEYWTSKKITDKYSIFVLNNGIIEYSNGSIKNQKINFEYGKPKYIETIVRGGAAYCLIVITEDGKAYKIIFNDGIDLVNECDQSKFKTVKIDLDEKIIDLTNGNGTTVPYSGPYYLTESGKLLTEDGISYDQINRNHIKSIGSLGRMVYINKDNTLETLRNPSTNEYIEVVNKNGEKIKAKYVFFESSERWTGTTSDHFFVIDTDDNLFEFSEMSLFVADCYNNRDKVKIIDFKYDESNSKVEFYYTDGSTEIIEKIYQYIEVK